MKRFTALSLSFFLTIISFSANAQAPRSLKPTAKDIAYANDHKAQLVDFYQAKSDEPTPVMVYIHGGGWRGGSKGRIPSFLSKAVNEGWLSVVSVEYRFTDVAVHPAQVNDCVRAIQFVRTKAAEWNLDPKRIGVCGGSAGAHLSLWVALHDDVAKSSAEDPVLRESSRVACAISFAGPTDWNLLSEIPHGHPAYRQLLGYEPGTPAEKMDTEKMASVSPISYASKDDPPILLVHGDEDAVVPIRHARDLQKSMNAVGGNSELFIVKGGKHNVAGAGGVPVGERSTAFVKEHLLGERPKTKILIVVGPEKHAPGSHEVAAGGRLMGHCLNNAENIGEIQARVFYEWPKAKTVIESASTLVFIGDQFPGERLENSEDVMRDLTAMMDRGCGIVCVHYATGLGADDVAADGDHPLLHWTGGYFATRCNHHQSVARIFEATITPAASANHPIRRGWGTFKVKDEPYTRNWFGKKGLDQDAISLATVEFPLDDPKTETVAWAIEREDGGRGMGITMPHFFRNWEQEELRRFILNGIVWTAQREVPKEGVKTTLPDLETFKPVSVDPKPRPPAKRKSKAPAAK